MEEFLKKEIRQFLDFNNYENAAFLADILYAGYPTTENRKLKFECRDYPTKSDLLNTLHHFDVLDHSPKGIMNIMRRNRCIIELAYDYQQLELLKIYEDILNDRSYLKGCHSSEILAEDYYLQGKLSKLNGDVVKAGENYHQALKHNKFLFIAFEEMCKIGLVHETAHYLHALDCNTKTGLRERISESKTEKTEHKQLKPFENFMPPEGVTYDENLKNVKLYSLPKPYPDPYDEKDLVDDDSFYPILDFGSDTPSSCPRSARLTEMTANVTEKTSYRTDQIKKTDKKTSQRISFYDDVVTPRKNKTAIDSKSTTLTNALRRSCRIAELTSRKDSKRQKTDEIEKEFQDLRVSQVREVGDKYLTAKELFEKMEYDTEYCYLNKEGENIYKLLFQIGKAVRRIYLADFSFALDTFSHLSVVQFNTCYIYCQVAKAYFELLDFEDAAFAFKQSLIKDSTYTKDLMYYSTALWKLCRDKELKLLCDLLSNHSKDLPEYHISKGNYYSRKNEHGKAIREFLIAIKLDPKISYSYVLCGHEMTALAKYNDAIVFYKKALEINKRSIYAFFGMGQLFMYQDNVQGALEIYEEAIKIFPSHPVLLCWTGTAYSQLKQYDKAFDHFDKAIAIDKLHMASLLEKGKALFEEGSKLDEAHKTFKKALEIMPKDMIAHYYLGLINTKLKKITTAFSYYTKALDLNASHENMQMIKRAIKVLSEKETINDNVL